MTNVDTSELGKMISHAVKYLEYTFIHYLAQSMWSIILWLQFLAVKLILNEQNTIVIYVHFVNDSFQMHMADIIMSTSCDLINIGKHGHVTRQSCHVTHKPYGI